MKANILACAFLSLVAFATATEAQVSSYLNAENRVVLRGEGVSLFGVDLISAGGYLSPLSSQDILAPAAPFAFFLAQSDSQVTLGSLDMVLLDGEIELGVAYLGRPADFATDMSGKWGGATDLGAIAFVPEPTTGILFSTAVIAVLGMRRRRTI